MSNPHKPAPVRDSKSSLYEAAVAAVKDREEAQARAPQKPFAPRRRRTLTILSLLGVVGAVLLVLQPDWLAGPEAPPPEPAAIAAASLRLSLLQERHLVFRYARANGRLPATLDEAGSSRPELEYAATGRDFFTLAGRVGDSLITLRSTDSLPTFLGSSLKLIKNRGETVKRNRGFTLIELMVVVLVIGILASIAMLKYIDLRNAAVATQMSQELRAVQVAAFNFYADKEQWPLEVGPGAVPAGLGPLLPGVLANSFDRDLYMLDYENFGEGGEVVIGVAVTTSDTKLFAKFVQYLGNKSPFFVSGSKLTYLISGPGGVF